jgi:hypothetical protein
MNKLYDRFMNYFESIECSKFLWNEHLKKVDKPRNFDHNIPDCNVFPTKEECMTIDKFVTQASIKEQNERRKNNPF